jgi:DNA primase
LEEAVSLSNYNPKILKKLVKKENVIQILESLGAHGINPRDPNGIRSSCPIHGSAGPTVFTYNPDKHLYVCYGDCDDNKKEGDLINLVEHSQNMSYSEAVEYMAEVTGLDLSLLKNNEEFLFEDLKMKLDDLLNENLDEESIEEDGSLYYGVNPIDESLLQNFLGVKDELGFIDSQGFSETVLELFESCYNSKEERWLLPQRNEEGILLGFDGRDITNKKKEKWKKRKYLKKNKILGRLDITAKYIEKENKIILGEGKKDMMAIFDAGLYHTSCCYGSSISIEQKALIDSMIDEEIIVFPDGDKSGYNYVKSVVKRCYPEYNITVPMIDDDMDPAELSKKFLIELYDNRIPVEEWLKMYEYRTKIK